MEKNANIKWTGKSRGGYWGNWCFAKLLKIGMLPAYGLLIFVAAFFLFCRRGTFKFMPDYLRRVLKKNVRQTSFEMYKLLYSFGLTLLDKTAFFAGSKKIVCRDFCEDKIRAAIEGGKGLVIVTSHIGGWQISSALLQKYGREVGVLGMSVEDEKVLRASEKNRVIKKATIIGKSDDTLALISAYSKLKKGAIIALHCDRFVSGRFEDVDFLGGRVKIPTSALFLAKKSSCNILQIICVREKLYTYKTEAFEFNFENPEFAKDEKSISAYFAKSFAKNMENTLQKHPYQWFNFYDYWG